MPRSRGKISVSKAERRAVARKLYAEGLGTKQLYAAPGEIDMPDYLCLYGGQGLQQRGGLYQGPALREAASADVNTFKLGDSTRVVDMSVYATGSYFDKVEELKHHGVEVPDGADIAWMNKQLWDLYHEQVSKAREQEQAEKLEEQRRLRDAELLRQRRALAKEEGAEPPPALPPATEPNAPVAEPAVEAAPVPQPPRDMKTFATRVLELNRETQTDLVELVAMACPDEDPEELTALKKNELIYKILEAAEAEGA